MARNAPWFVWILGSGAYAACLIGSMLGWGLYSATIWMTACLGGFRA